MVSFPFCKINIGLNVVAKRPNGYHDLETCFFPVPWTDILEIIPAKTLSFASTGLPIPGNLEENLCLRAYFLLREEFDLPPVAFHLHKVVPLGAGLGGGSADAAFCLTMLNDVFELNLNSDQMASRALQLGSDCPYFLHQTPMLGRGRGEQLTPIDVSLHGFQLVIVKAPVHISTADAFKGIIPRVPLHGLGDLLKKPVIHWREVVTNDFEGPVFEAFPAVRRIKESLYRAGAIFASMSGSGSAVYGIFSQPVDLTDYFQGSIYWSGTI